MKLWGKFQRTLLSAIGIFMLTGFFFFNPVSFKELRLNVYVVENKQAKSLNNVLSMKTLKLT